jgi:putative glutamine amidotransferase
MATRPLIGITTYRETARWGAWELPATLVPAAYVDAVVAAGGVPVLIPPVGFVTEALARLDGLVLTGGADLDPALYGAAPHPATDGVRPDRDAAEAALLRGALGGGLPVLGVCRGMQLLNVVHGGTLHQHLPDRVGHEGHRLTPGRFAPHVVETEPGSALRTLIGPRAAVPSYHHQDVAQVGDGLRVAARALDETIEALELPGPRLVLGVQWHPEAGEDQTLFEALVDDARAGRSLTRVPEGASA